MHQLVSAYAQLKAPTSPWAAVDLIGKTISEIANDYTDVYLQVSNNFWTQNRTMLFSEITNNYIQRNHTLEQFFTTIGNGTLPNINGIASIVRGKVKYADAFWAGYKINRTNRNQSPSTIPEVNDADSVIMSKPGVDARVFHKNCLVSINGLIHRTDADSQNAYVIDAGISNRHSGRNEVGILNFINVGELQTIAITPDMLFRQHADQPFANQIFIKSPVSAVGKTAALVFGGYLFLLDNKCFHRVAEDIFTIDTQSIALLDRFFESKDLIDLSPLGIEYNGKDKAQINKAELFSDAVLTKWLGLSQSFLLFIDNKNITVSRSQIAPTRIARQYLTYTEPTMPMVNGFGLIQPYWPQEDDDVFSLSVGDNVYDNRLFHTTPNEQSPMPADNRLPYNRTSYSPAHFLDIRSEKIVITPNT